MLLTIIALCASYLVGSIPTAYIFGRLMKGVDIREFGSGNVGATNAFRLLGKGPGMLVLALDVLKGIVPVLVFGSLAESTGWMEAEVIYILAGICCICGHVWTVFLNFRGGKGIATTLGVIIALSLKFPGVGVVVLILLGIWALVFVITRIVSISSVVSAICFPFLMFFLQKSVLMSLASLMLAVFVIYKHKANLIRFKQGKESRLKF